MERTIYNSIKIKRSTLFATLTALFLIAAVCQFPPALHAQTNHYAHTQQAQHTQPMRHAQKMPHTFTGKIMKLKNGKFAIITGKGPHGRLEGHFVDGSVNLKKYVGTKVQISGTLNIADNTVHVTKIRRA